MKKALYAVVILGLTTGWGLFFLKYQSDVNGKLAEHNTRITQEAKKHRAKGTARVTHIADMVNQSIDQDHAAVTDVDTKIAGLNDKISQIKTTISSLQTEKSGLKTRLAKLHKVLNVLEMKSQHRISTTDVKPKKAAATKPKKQTAAEKITRRLNRNMNESVAHVVDNNTSVVISVKGERFLIIDDKPARVSAEKSSYLLPFFQAIKKEHGIDKVYMRVKEGTSISQVLVLSKYFKSQFGWEPKIIPVPKTEKVATTIQLDIMATNKLAKKKTIEEKKKVASKKKAKKKSAKLKIKKKKAKARKVASAR